MDVTCHAGAAAEEEAAVAGGRRVASHTVSRPLPQPNIHIESSGESKVRVEVEVGGRAQLAVGGVPRSQHDNALDVSPRDVLRSSDQTPKRTSVHGFEREGRGGQTAYRAAISCDSIRSITSTKNAHGSHSNTSLEAADAEAVVVPALLLANFA
jgi:hypothetical protein